jgi:very-short-patch-repair endonuclease
MAAVLAVGGGAVLSHVSAAELWGIRRCHRRRQRAGGGGSIPVDVTVPGDGGRARREGIRLHRSATLSPAECTLQDGIPVTKPARTLADIRHLLSPAQLNAAVREAEFLRLPIGDLFGRSDRRAKGPDTDRTRTELEHRMLRLCLRHRLPKPEVNAKLDQFEVDFLWRRQRLVVEVDGWDSHRTRSAFEEDRARDARLTLLGFDVIRFTWRQVKHQPASIARTVRELLRRATPR